MSSSINRLLITVCLAITLVALVFSGQAQAGKNKGGEDIILYNGNIVLRGGGKGKGKGGGNIVVANSPQGMDMFGGFGGFGGFGR